jgi:hypothetical protein
VEGRSRSWLVDDVGDKMPTFAVAKDVAAVAIWRGQRLAPGTVPAQRVVGLFVGQTRARVPGISDGLTSHYLGGTSANYTARIT